MSPMRANKNRQNVGSNDNVRQTVDADVVDPKVLRRAIEKERKTYELESMISRHLRDDRKIKLKKMKLELIVADRVFRGLPYVEYTNALQRIERMENRQKELLQSIQKQSNEHANTYREFLSRMRQIGLNEHPRSSESGSNVSQTENEKPRVIQKTQSGDRSKLGSNTISPVQNKQLGGKSNISVKNQQQTPNKGQAQYTKDRKLEAIINQLDAQKGNHSDESSDAPIDHLEDRSRSSSPEIILVKGPKRKRPTQRPQPIDMSPVRPTCNPSNKENDTRLPGKVLVPVTKQSISRVLKILEKFENEERCAAIVFSSHFYLDELPFHVITEKFEPIFGRLTPEQVFVRIDIPRIADTPEEAYKLKFKNLNQAYIIGELNCTENDLNLRSAARQMFCCPMTIGCIKKNLKEGLYLMHRSVVLDPLEKNINDQVALEEVNSNSENETESPPRDRKQPSQKEQPVNSPPRKRDRIAASLGDQKSESTKNRPAPNSIPIDSSGEKTAVSRVKVDETLWRSIAGLGNCVLSICNLPAKLTVNSFNLMMGTTSIRSQQMIAKKRVIKNGSELIDMMIVLKSDSPDLAKLMDKNCLKTALGSKLIVQRSHHGALRKFLANSDDLIRLENSNKLPIKWVGYGGKCQ